MKQITFKKDFWKTKKKDHKPKSKTREWIDALKFAVIVATILKWGLLSAFTIPTPSMEGSLLVGDYLFVSKIHYGPRTPVTPLQVPLTHQRIPLFNISSYLDWIQLPSVRLPGFRDVKRNEPVVFNYPGNPYIPGEEDHPVDLKTYYVKRCVAIPGDELEIKDMKLFINGEVSPNPAHLQISYKVTSPTEPPQTREAGVTGRPGSPVPTRSDPRGGPGMPGPMPVIAVPPRRSRHVRTGDAGAAGLRVRSAAPVRGSGRSPGRPVPASPSRSRATRNGASPLPVGARQAPASTGQD